DEYLAAIIEQYSSVIRLKTTMKQYIKQLIKADVNEEYVKTRVKVGEIHSKINLSANYFLMAHNLLGQFITTILMEKLHRRPDKMIKQVLAIQKLLAFDQQLIVDVYYEMTFKTFLQEISGLLNDVTNLDVTQHLIESM